MSQCQQTTYFLLYVEANLKNGFYVWTFTNLCVRGIREQLVERGRLPSTKHQSEERQMVTLMKMLWNWLETVLDRRESFPFQKLLHREPTSAPSEIWGITTVCGLSCLWFLNWAGRKKIQCDHFGLMSSLNNLFLGAATWGRLESSFLPSSLQIPPTFLETSSEDIRARGYPFEKLVPVIKGTMRLHYSWWIIHLGIVKTSDSEAMSAALEEEEGWWWKMGKMDIIWSPFEHWPWEKALDEEYFS